MNQKKHGCILIVTAHPDDETLWFYAGIKRISKYFDVDVLCLTHKKDSFRAAELQRAAVDLPVEIIFGELEDKGFCSTLPNIEPTVRLLASKKNTRVLLRILLMAEKNRTRITYKVFTPVGEWRIAAIFGSAFLQSP